MSQETVTIGMKTYTFWKPIQMELCGHLGKGWLRNLSGLVFEIAPLPRFCTNLYHLIFKNFCFVPIYTSKIFEIFILFQSVPGINLFAMFCTNSVLCTNLYHFVPHQKVYLCDFSTYSTCITCKFLSHIILPYDSYHVTSSSIVHVPLKTHRTIQQQISMQWPAT